MHRSKVLNTSMMIISGYWQPASSLIISNRWSWRQSQCTPSAWLSMVTISSGQTGCVVLCSVPTNMWALAWNTYVLTSPSNLWASLPWPMIPTAVRRTTYPWGESGWQSAMGKGWAFLIRLYYTSLNILESALQQWVQRQPFLFFFAGPEGRTLRSFWMFLRSLFYYPFALY